jgi:signal transduction histidine kinase
VTDSQGDLPANPSQPVRAPGRLDDLLARWRSDDLLPTAVVDGVLDRLRRRIAAGGRTPVDGASWPDGWPAAHQVLPALAALAQLQDEATTSLLEGGLLDAVGLASVQAEFAPVRQRIAQAAGAGTRRPLTVRDAIEARDRQLSIATHELRTPISSILLNLQMLERASRERGSLGAEAIARLLAVPSRQLRRLTRMVDLLLDAAQVETERLELRPEPVDLCELVHEAAGRLRELARASGCSITLEGCAPVAGCWDRMRLEQVVTNLMTNAIKYGGGRVEVRTGRAAGTARIVVRDRGGGIAPEDQERIFRPFERLAASGGEDGAGLGLYIVREIVRAHGGRIDVDSTPGRGSTFTVHLPV